MSNALALKIELAARATVPAGVTAVLMLLGSIAMNGTHVQVLEPVLALASIYYWSLYRPDLMPAALVFALGLLYDILSGAPVGSHAAMLTVAHARVDAAAPLPHRQDLRPQLVGFAVVAGAGCILVSASASLFYAAPVDPWGLLFQMLMTIVAYPLIFRLLLHCHLSLVQPG